MMKNEDVIIKKIDGYKLYMDFFWDEEKKRADRPCLLWIHGGAWRDHALDRKYIPPQIEKWIDAGYLVASGEYRLSDEAKWPAQIEDCRYDVEYLKDHAKELEFDKEKLYVWGESAGAHLCTYLANDGKIAGAVIWYPPILFESKNPDFNLNIWGKELVRKETLTSEDVRSLSPIYDVNSHTCPCLIMHGDIDDVVAYKQGMKLYERMKYFDLDATFITVPGQGHGFFKDEELYDKILKWMKK